MTRLSLVSDAIVEPTLLGIIAFNHLLGFSISFFDRHQRFVHDLYLCIEFCTYLVNFCILLLQCCQVLLILGYCSVRHSTFSHLTDMALADCSLSMEVADAPSQRQAARVARE